MSIMLRIGYNLNKTVKSHGGATEVTVRQGPTKPGIGIET